MANNKKAEAKPKKTSIIKDAVALFLITLIAGTLLGLVNDVTKEPIAEANLKAKMDAYQAVFADAAEFRENADITAMVEDTAAFEALIAEANKTDAYKELPIESVEISEVLEAVDASGNVLGYVVSFSSGAGYGGDINMSLGVTNEGEITGFEVISNSETAGLGANGSTPEFKSQFTGINTASIMYTKSGKQEGTDPAQIDAISGATITTKAVTRAVNGVLLFIRVNCLGM